MPATVGSLLQLHEDRITEVINKNLDVILPSLDPVWRDTVVTSQGVGPSDAIGRDMNILKVFMGSMAGVLEQGKPRADFPLYGDDTDGFGPKLYEQNLVQTFPSALDGPNARPYRLGIPMRSMVANIMFTLGELQAEALPATIGQIVAPKLEGFARNIAHTLSNYWWISQNDDYELCKVPTAGMTTAPTADATSGGWYFDFQPDNQACDRFYVGQRLDMYETTGATRQNESGGSRVPLYCSHVDELTNTVRLVTTVDPAVSWDGGDPVATDIVVYANSRDGSSPNFTGIAGINSWLKTGSGSDDNFLLGGERITSDAIDVTVHPEHKSFSKALGSTPLTEHKLRMYLRRFHAAKNKYGYYIDCLLASDGVWMAYEGTKIGRELLDRTGRLSSLMNEGSNNTEYGGFKFTFDGRTYEGYTSSYIENETMYGIRKGGSNWKRYVPPDASGVRNFGQVDSFVPFRFVSGMLTGLGTNQLPIYDTSGNNNLVTEGSQMPGWLRMQLVPDQPCGMKLTGIAEDRMYSDN